jgi:hypothetical protein
MYNLIFYYIYRQQINKGKSNGFARFNGSLIVFVAFCFDIMLLMAIMQKYFGNKVDIRFLTSNKFLEYILFFFCIWCTYSYYNSKRAEKIESKFLAKEWFDNYGGVVTLLLIFVPLMLIIIILS